MPFTVTIHQSTDRTDSNNPTHTQVYSQTVDSLDLKAVINVINTPPPPEPPKKKRRSDAGKPRAQKATAAPFHVQA